VPQFRSAMMSLRAVKRWGVPDTTWLDGGHPETRGSGSLDRLGDFQSLQLHRRGRCGCRRLLVMVGACGRRRRFPG
jgi:hypothetical protein